MVKLLSILGQIVFWFIRFFERERWIQAGKDAQIKMDLAHADKAIKRAKKVRDRANADNADPDRLRNTDGHKRD